MSDNSSSEVVPGWVSALLTEDNFFNACIIHENLRKNEKNVFCFDCCLAICPHCLIHHPSHRLLRIRRYMYHDVIKIKDAEKIMDCAQLQHYKTNSSKVVFLNQRPPTKPSKTCPSFCVYCHKNLQYSYIYCCLFCKLQHLQSNGAKLSTVLRTTNFPTFSEPGSDDGLLTPDSELEHSDPSRPETSSTGSGEYHDLLICATTDHITRKKRTTHPTGVRSVCRPVCTPVSEQCYSEETGMNRRKGTPHRAPLY